MLKCKCKSVWNKLVAIILLINIVKYLCVWTEWMVANCLEWNEQKKTTNNSSNRPVRSIIFLLKCSLVNLNHVQLRSHYDLWHVIVHATLTVTKIFEWKGERKRKKEWKKKYVWNMSTCTFLSLHSFISIIRLSINTMFGCRVILYLFNSLSISIPIYIFFAKIHMKLFYRNFYFS